MVDLSRIREILGIRKGMPLTRVFSYSAPVYKENEFAPRPELHAQIKYAFDERGAQLFVWGPEKSGKTSLIVHMLEKLRLESVLIQCEDELDVDTLLENTLNRLGKSHLALTLRSENETEELGMRGFGIAIGSGQQTVHEAWSKIPCLADIAELVTERGIILWYDDAHRLRSQRARDCLVRLSKMISDRAVSLRRGKLLISSTIDQPEEATDNWGSSESRFCKIFVNRMTDDEIRAIIKIRAGFALLSLSDSVLEKIVTIARGRPGVAKLLALEAGRTIAERAGISDARLTGTEQAVDEELFDSVVLQRAADRGHVYT